MNRRTVGTKYEQIAAEYLQNNGVCIQEKNFRCRQGEIDIIGHHEGYLVFFEVKYRTTEKMGMAEEAVTPAKQKRICHVADYYRYSCRIGSDTPIRYDVVAIQGKNEGGCNIRWYRNAFFHIYTN